ncbi:hypothetical protein E2C01_083622 [Portunus trituberculatus]|uniref:Uncharacterized protein n=1 Tax=Portunus trituberculatus TaxID=210409 RepID=A0A5B7J2M3_PORTR|nr:hypothetical protein [Portunus trituberculatus]
MNKHGARLLTPHSLRWMQQLTLYTQQTPTSIIALIYKSLEIQRAPLALVSLLTSSVLPAICAPPPSPAAPHVRPAALRGSVVREGRLPVCVPGAEAAGRFHALWPTTVS